jgi:hypothetical protein
LRRYNAGLSTLIPCATDHSKPYAYMAKDPFVFFGSPEHVQLVGIGGLVVITAFSAAVGLSLRGCVDWLHGSYRLASTECVRYHAPY